MNKLKKIKHKKKHSTAFEKCCHTRINHFELVNYLKNGKVKVMRRHELMKISHKLKHKMPCGTARCAFKMAVYLALNASNMIKQKVFKTTECIERLFDFHEKIWNQNIDDENFIISNEKENMLNSFLDILTECYSFMTTRRVKNRAGQILYNRKSCKFIYNLVIFMKKNVNNYNLIHQIKDYVKTEKESYYFFLMCGIVSEENPEIGIMDVLENSNVCLEEMLTEEELDEVD